MNYFKWGISCVALLVLAGCNANATSSTKTSTTTQSTTQVSTSMTKESTTKSSTTSTSMETTTNSQEPTTSSSVAEAQSQLTPVGTWSNGEETLTIAPDGHWQFSGGLQSGGTLSVAAMTPDTWLLKLYGFNNSIDGIGTYQLAVFNDQGTKMNFGYLGTFERQAQATQPLSTAVYQAQYVTTPTDFTQSIIGTWSTKDKNYDFQTMYNFNPDGTFERFADAKGVADSGTYTLTQNPDSITLTLTNQATGTDQTLTYRLDNSQLTDTQFEWASLIRNTVPSKP